MSVKTHTVTTYHCDRCGCALGATKPRWTVAATCRVDRGATGNRLAWEDFCAPCADAVVDFFAGKSVGGVLVTFR